MAKKSKTAPKVNPYLVWALGILLFVSGLFLFQTRSQITPTPYSVEEIERFDREAERINKTIFQINDELTRLQKEDQLTTAGANQKKLKS